VARSGYDFGYFVKLLTNVSLPTTEETFFELLRTWFPTVYDIKYMMRASKVLKGGLQDVADDLGVWTSLYIPTLTHTAFVKVMRIGSSHQAGSDSLLTAATFFKMRELYFGDRIDDPEYNGKLYGLGQTFSLSNGLVDPGRGGMTIAEREDRALARELHNQTPASSSQNHLGGLPTQALGGSIPTSSTPYGPMSNGPYIRSTMVGGR
jgi:CCR4-NOT transcription complex subunit 7/8